MNKSLRQRVLEAIQEGGIMTISQVVSKIGKYIAASQAATRGRMCRRKSANRRSRRDLRIKSSIDLMELGRRQIISENLVKLARSGKIQRVRKATYGPIAINDKRD